MDPTIFPRHAPPPPLSSSSSADVSEETAATTASAADFTEAGIPASSNPGRRQSRRLAELQEEWDDLARQAAEILSNARPMSPMTRRAIYESELSRFDVLKYVFSPNAEAPPLPLPLPMVIAAPNDPPVLNRAPLPNRSCRRPKARVPPPPVEPVRPIVASLRVQADQESSSSEDDWGSDEELGYRRW
ncbi:hypothetical protein Esti_004235 [Eimeria stiedai]